MTLDEARERYLAAVLEGSRRTAFGVVDEAFRDGIGLRELYLGVFQPAMRDIGRLWQENRITVADEHLATAITQAAMARLYDELFRGGGAAGPLLIAACADTERHELGLRMICDVLEMEGWDTVFLGATVPIEDLVAMVRERRPHVVALSASISPHLPRVRATIDAIREAMPGAAPLIAVGGRAFADDPGLAERLGADLTAADAVQAARLLKERVSV
ncbi:cobalamin B12-binding domain-containing protein [Longimicrobium sp.]|uniref:cobalamin B12-binding domain-containing protein n=1 Tax=Longimicrobium sp. TaxID=2029185 RepID=UPI002EDB60FE